jgi:hypothetical protein
VRYLAHVGLFLVLASLYALSGPGRIDMIDGQYRYEVARHVLTEGRPILRDPALPNRIVGRDGEAYSAGPGRAVTALPLVGLGLLFEHQNHELTHFLFSFTSALLSAIAGVVLFMLYELLGVGRMRALGWTFVVACCTLMWPLATSTFDQAQHACIVLVSVYAGLQAARRDSPWCAFLAGAAAGALISCQEVYVVLAPTLVLACLRDGETIKQLIRARRFFAFAAGGALVVALLVLHNLWWLGSPLASTTGSSNVLPLFGNPVMGAIGLLFSPGKSVFLYSPPLLLAVFGWRHLRARHRSLARTIAIIVGVHFALIASLTFWGGDWAWGPRYIVVTLPLICLSLPFVRVRRAVTVAIVGVGLCVQLLAISVDHQRFFFERALPDDFWLDDSFYFHESALFARPAELISILANKPDGELDPHGFAPNPYRSPTYAPFGNAPSHRAESPQWMQHFAVFYVPRPWPLWMATLPPESLPIARGTAIGVLLALLFAGVAALGAALRLARRDQPASSESPTGL